MTEPLKTLCLNCGRVLTAADGGKIEDAIFDSSLPCKEEENGTIWARCCVCHETARKMKRRDWTIEMISEDEPDAPNEDRHIEVGDKVIVQTMTDNLEEPITSKSVVISVTDDLFWVTHSDGKPYGPWSKHDGTWRGRGFPGLSRRVTLQEDT